MRILLFTGCREGISHKRVLQPASGKNGGDQSDLPVPAASLYSFSLKYSTCQGAIYCKSVFWNPSTSLSSGQKGRKIDFFERQMRKWAAQLPPLSSSRTVTSPPQLLWFRTRGWYVTSRATSILISEFPPTQLFREVFFCTEDSVTGNAAGGKGGVWLSFQAFAY